MRPFHCVWFVHAGDGSNSMHAWYLIHKIVADPLHVRLLHCHAIPILQRNTTLDQQEPASAPVLRGTSSDSKQTFCSISLLLDIVALCWTSKEARSPLVCGVRSPLDLHWARWLPDLLMDWRKGALCSSISGCTSPLAQCGPRCQPAWENFRVDGVQQPCRKQASAHNQCSQVMTLERRDFPGGTANSHIHRPRWLQGGFPNEARTGFRPPGTWSHS